MIFFLKKKKVYSIPISAAKKIARNDWQLQIDKHLYCPDYGM